MLTKPVGSIEKKPKSWTLSTFPGSDGSIHRKESNRTLKPVETSFVKNFKPVSKYQFGSLVSTEISFDIEISLWNLQTGLNQLWTSSSVRQYWLLKKLDEKMNQIFERIMISSKFKFNYFHINRFKLVSYLLISIASTTH